MTWDKKKIETLLNNINKKIKNAVSKKELSILMFDYFSLIEILKTFEIEDYYDIIRKQDLQNIKFSDLSEFYEGFYKDSYECLRVNKDILINISSKVDMTSLASPKIGFNKRINESNYLDMVAEFFSNYDKEHYEIFKELIDGNIHFAKSEAEVGNRAKGKCYHLLSTEDTYIITNFRDKKNVSVLPHEIAHAYELSQLKNIIHRSSWHFSSFTESYPKFMELAFLDYFLDSEYGNYFLKLKYYILDNLKLSSEYALSFITNLNDKNELIDFSKEKRKLRLTKKYLDYVLSDMFAIYLFNLYKNDREYFDMIIKKFHSYKGKSDELIWSLFNEENLINAFKQEINSYKKEISLSRTKN